MQCKVQRTIQCRDSAEIPGSIGSPSPRLATPRQYTPERALLSSDTRHQRGLIHSRDIRHHKESIHSPVTRQLSEPIYRPENIHKYDQTYGFYLTGSSWGYSGTNSGKSKGVVWKNLLLGGPKGNQTRGAQPRWQV